MSVRVVARVRPLLKAEGENDVIVDTPGDAAVGGENRAMLKIPNPKNEGENFSFHFNSVYGREATQAQLFENEVSSTVKHLFKGFDVTLFAYGVTGTGKTHTMRGGKSLAERGMIPRLLSSIYRRARKIEKDTSGGTQVEVAMSYYEIYNDKVFDLFESPEKRTPAGLPIRDNHGKTVVVGLTERPCETLKDFEHLYDTANVNRSTSATKLNAHSSRSHAILCVKITQTTGEETRVSTASAIDLAGSEDNRRTENNKERLVESASINKSLFVLAQCVEAISKKQSRIPYRESKMTRILSLGQNNGHTVMILNLAPVRSYHLDTLSSLNFANRTKKIEVNEIENQPMFKARTGKEKLEGPTSSYVDAPSMHRQPLRPKLPSQNSHLKEVTTNTAKPAKQFAVFSDKPKVPPKQSHLANTSQARSSSSIPIKSPKRTSSEANPGLGGPNKASKIQGLTKAISKPPPPGMSQEAIEAFIEKKVMEALAERADSTTVSNGDPISDEVQKRLDALEKRVKNQDNERSDGLQYLLMAKQHQVRGEDASALKMYQIALPHFPDNDKLVRKVAALHEKLAAQPKPLKHSSPSRAPRIEHAATTLPPPSFHARRKPKTAPVDEEDASFHDAGANTSDDEPALPRPRTKIRRPHTMPLHRPASSTATTSNNPNNPFPPPSSHDSDSDSEHELATALTSGPADSTDPAKQTPRTKRLLNIINSRDVSQIRLLKGVGAKRAEAIVGNLIDLGEGEEGIVRSLGGLGLLKGVGGRTVEGWRGGLGGE